MGMSGQVAITVKEDASSHSSTANKQFLLYFGFLYFMAVPFMDLLIALRVRVINENQSLYEVNGFFLIMSIVALSVAVLISVVMVSTNYCMQISMMRDVHYTILKAIGCFSASLAPFSLVMVLFVPRNLNWIGYSFVCVIFGIVVTCYLKLKGFLGDFESFLQGNKSNKFPKIYYTGLLVPLSLILVLFVPNNLNWIVFSVIQLFFWIVIVYVTFLAIGYVTLFRQTWKPHQVIEEDKARAILV